MKILALVAILFGIVTNCGNIIPNPIKSVNPGASPAATYWTPSASNWQCPSPPAATFVGSYNPATGWAGICTLASGEVCSGSAAPTGFAGTCSGGTGASPIPGASSSPGATCVIASCPSAPIKVVVPVCDFARRGTQDNGCSNGSTAPPQTQGNLPSPSGTVPGPQASSPCPPASILPAHAAGDTTANGKIIIENIPLRYGALIQAAVTKYNAKYGADLTVPFVEAVIYQESKGDPNAQSGDGQDSEGLMQVSTFGIYDIADKLSPGADQYDPAVSIDTGVHLLAIMDQCGTINDPLTQPTYSPFPGACGNLTLLAAKYQLGPLTTVNTTYSAEVLTWMQDFVNGTEPTTGGAVPSGC